MWLQCRRRELSRVWCPPSDVAQGDATLSAFWWKYEGQGGGNCQEARERGSVRSPSSPNPQSRQKRANILPEWKQRVVTGNDTTSVLMKLGAQETLLSYNKIAETMSSPPVPWVGRVRCGLWGVWLKMGQGGGRFMTVPLGSEAGRQAIFIDISLSDFDKAGLCFTF